MLGNEINISRVETNDKEATGNETNIGRAAINDKEITGNEINISKKQKPTKGKSPQPSRNPSYTPQPQPGPQPFPSFIIKMITVVCALFIIIVIVIVLWLTRDKPVAEIETALDNADYSLTVSIYNEKVYGNARKENQVNTLIETTIDSIEKEYLEQQCSFEEASRSLDLFSKLYNNELSNKAIETSTRVENNENSFIALSDGIRKIEQKDYIGAMKTLVQVKKGSTSYDEARKKTEECAGALVDLVLSDQNEIDYSEALDIIDSALKVFPDDSETQKCRDEINAEYEAKTKENAIAVAEDHMKNGEFKAAIETINDTIKKFKDDTDLVGKKTEYEKIIREKYLDNAKKCADANDYAGALMEIDNGLSILKNDEVLLSRKKEYEPISITELTSISDTPTLTKRLTDNYGNDYDYAFVNEERFTKLEYLINSKFKHLEGIIYIPEGENDYGFSSLVIKGDGFVLYSSPLMDKTSRPVAFNVDISGFDRLVIEWRVYGITTSYHLKCCLGNIHLFYCSEGTVNNTDYSALPISLLDLRGIGSESRCIRYLTDTAGNTYNLAIFNDNDHNQSGAIPIFEYLLDSKYRKFECTLYIPENHRPYHPIVMIARADGKEIYRSPEITEKSGPIVVEIDLSGCNDFQITFSGYATSGDDRDALCLANPYVYLK